MPNSIIAQIMAIMIGSTRINSMLSAARAGGGVATSVELR